LKKILAIGLLIIAFSWTKSVAQNTKRQRTVITKDSTKYSKRFLKSLREQGYGTKFELIDDTIITDNKYRSGFAQFLPEKKDVFLKGQKKGRRYEIKLKRVNYSTISYDFTFTDENGNVIKEKGQADKSPNFMLGSESDEDDNGGGYFCSEYYSVDNDCLAVRIGLRDKKIVAKIKGCGDKLTLENSPTLR
jgi:hypothetical protein